MIGAISYTPYAYNRWAAQVNPASQQNRLNQAGRTAPAQAMGGVTAARRANSLETPVQPAPPVTSVKGDEMGPGDLGFSIRQGVDPVEMAVRMRIQYPEEVPSAQQNMGAELKLPESDEPVGAEAAQKALEEGECQTCEQRKYQDGSDDMGVSYQTPTRIDPDQAASAVRGHEMEHVVREQAKAQREDRRVVSQTVTLHTEICPECGKAYVSGGTTRTVTSGNSQPEPQAQNQDQQARQPFMAMA